MKKKIAVVVPYYSDNIKEEERISLMQIERVFKGRDIIYIAPQKLKSERFADEKVIFFENRFFEGREGYNSLMLSPLFYEAFSEYDYILICQTDVFVFEDRLDYFCDLGYDYIGAPWLNGVKSYEGNGYKVCYIGNGGLSLRKTKSMMSFFYNHQPERFFWEDYYISSYKDVLKISPINVALEFAFEGDVKECLKLSKKWPMGIHGWWRFDFSAVKEEIAKRGYDVAKIEDEEYDINPNNIQYKGLDTDAEAIKDKLYSYFPNLDNKILIWGAGYYGDIVGWILKKAEIESFYYIDNSNVLFNRHLHGKKIRSLQQINDDMINDFTWIIGSEKYECEIEFELKSLGVNKKNIIFFKNILNCLNMYKVK